MLIKINKTCGVLLSVKGWKKQQKFVMKKKVWIPVNMCLKDSSNSINKLRKVRKFCKLYGFSIQKVSFPWIANFQFSWKNPLYVLLPRKLVLSNVSRFFQEILEKSFFDENIKNGPVESILSYKYSFSIPWRWLKRTVKLRPK